MFIPYLKNNANPIYVNTKPSHHPSIIKQIPNYQNRLNNNSDKNVFKKASNTVLKYSWYYNIEIKYKQQDNNCYNKIKDRRKKYNRTKIYKTIGL